MKPSQKTLALWIVLFVVFLDWMGIGLVYPMFSSMLFHPQGQFAHLGLSEAAKGWYLGALLAAMSIAQFFSSPIIGALSDQKGRKPLFLISLVIAILGYGLCLSSVLAKSFIGLVAARIFVGIAAGNASVVTATIADLSTPDNKTRHYGLYSMACGVGFTIGPFLGGRLSEITFSLPFLVAGLAVLLNLLFIIFLFKETHAIPAKAPLRIEIGFANLKKAFQMKGLRVLFLTVLIYLFGWSFFYEFIPVTWIADYGFDAGKIGLFYAYGAGVYALSTGLLIQPIVNRFKDRTVLFYSLLLMGGSIMALLVKPSSFWIWIYIPWVNFLIALLYPTSTAMVSNWAKEDAQGETLGILQSVQAASFAFSPLIAGALLGNNPHMPLVIGGTSMLLAGILFGICLRKQLFTKTV